MKTVAFVPIKKVSKRVTSKNFRPFNGVPLYQWFLQKLQPAIPEIDDVYVDTDSQEIADYATAHGFHHFPRDPKLAEDGANGNDLLVAEAERIHADIYVQLFVTAPLLRSQTIQKAVQTLHQHPHYDSVFTAVKRRSWFWFDDQPVNYDPKVLPRSQDAKPIVQESTGLYAIRRDALLKDRCRIGRQPCMLYIDDAEAVDIDTELEFKMAEYLHKLIEEGDHEHP